MNDSTLFDLIPAYALGALSDAERAQVEAFLAESEDARNELRVYQAMLTGMATNAPPRQAPAHLTEDFRKRLSTESTPAAIPFTQRRVSRTRWMAALAALLVVAVGVLVVLRSMQQDDKQLIQQILTDNAATKVALLPQAAATGSITFVSVPSGKQAVLNTQLPPLPNEQQYQLWYIKGGSQPDPSVTFDGTQNTNPVLVPAPDPAKQYDTIAITVEPRGGSKAPSNPPIFVGTLS